MTVMVGNDIRLAIHGPATLGCVLFTICGKELTHRCVHPRSEVIKTFAQHSWGADRIWIPARPCFMLARSLSIWKFPEQSSFCPGLTTFHRKTQGCYCVVPLCLRGIKVKNKTQPSEGSVCLELMTKSSEKIC